MQAGEDVLVLLLGDDPDGPPDAARRPAREAPAGPLPGRRDRRLQGGRRRLDPAGGEAG